MANNLDKAMNTFKKVNSHLNLLGAIVEWLYDHPQAKQDVINYVKKNYPQLENDLIFEGLN